MPEETGPQTVSGRLPAEARAEDHQIPADAQGNDTQTHTDVTARNTQEFN